MGCINRDENAVNNMIKIVNTYLMNKTRPEKFRKDYKFSKKIKIIKDDKSDNPNWKNEVIKKKYNNFINYVNFHDYKYLDNLSKSLII